MSKAFYPVAGGTARAGKAAYAVLSGLTRKVKAGYAVRGGVHRQFYCAGPLVTFSGAHTISDITIDGKAYKLMTMTGSGTLTVAGEGVRYWMCGGGGNGGTSSATGSGASWTYYSGAGGGGGYVKTGILSGGRWTVLIGSAGSETSMSKGTNTITAGGGADTGAGGTAGGCAQAFAYPTLTVITTYAYGTGVSTYPFGLVPLYAHCAGGGSGAFGQSNPAGKKNGYNGGTNGGDGTTIQSSGTAAGGTGGTKGGGDGGVGANSASLRAGGAATFYGAGGGGGGMWLSSTGTGGAGYQGVAYVLVPAA